MCIKDGKQSLRRLHTYFPKQNIIETRYEKVSVILQVTCNMARFIFEYNNNTSIANYTNGLSP